MNKIKTLTIGISAYNEEQNIKRLLTILLKQKYKNVLLNSIIVISDGSTDNTVKIAKTIKSKKIFVIDNNIREGAMQRQNEILKMTNSEILILLDADVLPIGTNFVEKLVKPICMYKDIGIVGADTKCISGKGLFEKIIVNSHEFKKVCIKKYIMETIYIFVMEEHVHFLKHFIKILLGL